MFEVLGRFGRPRAATCQRREADVGGDRMQPSAELRARLVAVGAFPRAQHRLLELVVGVVERAEQPVTVKMEGSPVGLDQERERLLIHRRGTLVARWAGWIGPDLCPRPGCERAGRAADRHEPDPLRARADLAQLVGADADHRARAELELATVGDEGRRAAERDVDLLLVGGERLGAVVVVRVTVPVGRQREHLHPPGRHAKLGTRAAREPAVDRLHVVDRLDRYVRHRPPPSSREDLSRGSTRAPSETNRCFFSLPSSLYANASSASDTASSMLRARPLSHASESAASSNCSRRRATVSWFSAARSGFPAIASAPAQRQSSVVTPRGLPICRYRLSAFRARRVASSTRRSSMAYDASAPSVVASTLR